MNLDEVIEETKRVNYELGRLEERNRIIEIVDYLDLRINDIKKGNILSILKKTILD